MLQHKRALRSKQARNSSQASAAAVCRSSQLEASCWHSDHVTQALCPKAASWSIGRFASPEDELQRPSVRALLTYGFPVPRKQRPEINHFTADPIALLHSLSLQASGAMLAVFGSGASDCCKGLL